jgi:hypothetical protein
MDKVLRGAIAYRQDFDGRESWANARPESIPVSCPSGCMVEYDMVVSERASADEVLRWIEAVLEQMETEHPRHANVIVF